MSWNGSDHNGARESGGYDGRESLRDDGTRNPAQRHSGATAQVEKSSGSARNLGGPLRVTVALALFVALGGCVWWLVDGSRHAGRAPLPRGKDEARHVFKTRPAEVAGAVASADTNAHRTPVRRSRKGTPIPDSVQPDARGILRHPGGLRWVDTNDLHIVKHPRKRLLFTHACDNQIATLLTLDPTRMAPFLVGRRRPYGPQFVEDFKASLAAPPEAHDRDDTPEEAEVRKAVVETKVELKARMDAGEDIAQVMNDTQKELDRLCQYHAELKQELSKIECDETFSDDDVRDYVAAANKLLEKQGIAGFTMPNLLHRQVRLRLMRERHAQETQGTD